MVLRVYIDIIQTKRVWFSFPSLIVLQLNCQIISCMCIHIVLGFLLHVRFYHPIQNLLLHCRFTEFMLAVFTPWHVKVFSRTDLLVFWSLKGNLNYMLPVLELELTHTLTKNSSAYKICIWTLQSKFQYSPIKCDKYGFFMNLLKRYGHQSSKWYQTWDDQLYILRKLVLWLIHTVQEMEMFH